MDDRALLRQAFLEAYGIKQEVPQMEEKGLQLSRRTDRRILRMIYRDSRRRRFFRTVSAAARSMAAFLLIAGLFFFPNIGTDATFQSHQSVFVTDDTDVFFIHIGQENIRAGEQMEHAFSLEAPQGFVCEAVEEGDIYQNLVYKPELLAQGGDPYAYLYLNCSVNGSQQLSFDLLHCLNRGWRDVGSRRVYWMEYADACQAVWIEEVDGKAYTIEMGWFDKGGVSQEAFDRMIKSVTAQERGKSES